MLNTAEQSEPSAVTQKLLVRHKFTVNQQKTVLKILKKDPGIASSVLIKTMKDNHDPLRITERHLNRIRELWDLSRAKGRPKLTDLEKINSEEMENPKKKRNNSL
jgi:hypothetical protein